MPDLLAAMAAALLLGTLRGLSVCLLVCAPGMIPVIIGEGAGPLRSLRLGLLLSLPRILVLTALGAVLGLLSFGLASAAPARALLSGVSVIAYFLIGVLLLLTGLRILTRADACGSGGGGGRVESSRPQSPQRGRGAWGKRGRSFLLHILSSHAAATYPGGMSAERLFLIWGALLSLACLAELGILEAAALSALAGASSPGPAPSAGLGAMMMLLFSLGASTPVLLAAAAGGALVRGLSGRALLLKLRDVSAVLMVLVGIYFIGLELFTGARMALQGAGW
ncbi:MAG: hypothetical protein QW379_07045 [Thermoplasmata archaeon]